MLNKPKKKADQKWHYNPKILNFCIVIFKCGQHHINIIKSIQFCQLCKSKKFNLYFNDQFEHDSQLI